MCVPNEHFGTVEKNLVNIYGGTVVRSPRPGHRQDVSGREKGLHGHVREPSHEVSAPVGSANTCRDVGNAGRNVSRHVCETFQSVGACRGLPTPVGTWEKQAGTLPGHVREPSHDASAPSGARLETIAPLIDSTQYICRTQKNTPNQKKNHVKGISERKVTTN